MRLRREHQDVEEEGAKEGIVEGAEVETGQDVDNSQNTLGMSSKKMLTPMQVRLRFFLTRILYAMIKSFLEY